MLEQSFTLCGRSIVDATFSEMRKPGVHDMAFVTLVHSIELYFKAKLLEKDKDIIFNKQKTKTININNLPKLLKKYYNIEIDIDRFNEMVELRNKLMHLGVSNINTSYETLNYCFTFYIPILEKKFPNDLEQIFNMVGYWDEAIFEGYLIEQLDIDEIPYSKYIKENFLKV